MEKGIVVEQKRKKSIVMTRDGGFYKTKQEREVAVGEEIVFDPKQQASFSLDRILSWFSGRLQWQAILSIVLCLALIIPFYTWMSQDQTYAYVNIDINPSIELQVDQGYKVIHAHALNDDGNELLEEMSEWKGRSLEFVSKGLIDTSEELGFISEDQDILFGVSFVKRMLDTDQEALDLLSETLSDQLGSNGKLSLFEVPKNIREQSIELESSMNSVFANELMENPEDGEGEMNFSNVEEETRDALNRFLDSENEEQINAEEDYSSDAETTEETVDHEEDPEPTVAEEESNEPQTSNQNSDNREKDENHPSNKKSGNSDKDEDHPSNQKSNNSEKEESHPSNQKSNNSDKDEDHPSNQKSNNSDKDENHPSKKGKSKDHNNGKKDSTDQDEEKDKSEGPPGNSGKDKDFTPPGQKKKENNAND
ncbi:anti-sigma factor domain-containing protein [Halalkalibacillus halophilus]|uniref:anti-sigma factor domain-containing protein n=1 Tax=Halalkalibacillus halophilus TaxID=392827 RepID=UPI00040E7EA5|nr:anti-sigma factor domain-containing protein [Halalkalibacillus halophilus]